VVVVAFYVPTLADIGLYSRFIWTLWEQILPGMFLAALAFPVAFVARCLRTWFSENSGSIIDPVRERVDGRVATGLLVVVLLLGTLGVGAAVAPDFGWSGDCDLHTRGIIIINQTSERVDSHRQASRLANATLESSSGEAAANALAREPYELADPDPAFESVIRDDFNLNESDRVYYFTPDGQPRYTE
jgi:hypothetical protein